jgi:hypothetical protein
MDPKYKPQTYPSSCISPQGIDNCNIAKPTLSSPSLATGLPIPTTTTPPPVNCKTNPNDLLCAHPLISPPTSVPPPTKKCPDGSVIDASATCPLTPSSGPSSPSTPSGPSTPSTPSTPSGPSTPSTPSGPSTPSQPTTIQ